jgi:GGDEF domain-containing protein
MDGMPLSIRNFVESQVAASETSLEELDAWSSFGRELLDACGEHAVCWSTEEREVFRKRIRETAQELEVGATASQVLIATGSLTQTLQDYARRTQQHMDDLRETAGLLLAHIGGQSDGLPACGQLQELEREMHGVPPGGMALFRERLTACLQALAEGEAGNRGQSEDLLNTLRDRVTVLEQMPASRAAEPPKKQISAIDACTGLPSRAEAEIALQQALEKSGNLYICIFYIHRMNLTNARFGEAVGNQVILYCSQQIASQILLGADMLYRWSGPAFLAILDRDESAQAVANEVHRMASAPMSRFFETSSRSVYLPMKISAQSVPAGNKSYAEVADMIEKFVLRGSQHLD